MATSVIASSASCALESIPTRLVCLNKKKNNRFRSQRRINSNSSADVADGGDGGDGTVTYHEKQARCLGSNYSVQDMDVLCGGMSRSLEVQHKGNHVFKRLIASKLEKYQQSLSKAHKSAIVKQIVEHMRDLGAQFVKRQTYQPPQGEVDHAGRDKNDCNHTANSDDHYALPKSLWYDIGNTKAREKASNAIRVMLAQQRAAAAAASKDDQNNNNNQNQKRKRSYQASCSSSSIMTTEEAAAEAEAAPSLSESTLPMNLKRARPCTAEAEESQQHQQQQPLSIMSLSFSPRNKSKILPRQTQPSLQPIATIPSASRSSPSSLPSSSLSIVSSASSSDNHRDDNDSHDDDDDDDDDCSFLEAINDAIGRDHHNQPLVLVGESDNEQECRRGDAAAQEHDDDDDDDDFFALVNKSTTTLPISWPVPSPNTALFLQHQQQRRTATTISPTAAPKTLSFCQKQQGRNTCNLDDGHHHDDREEDLLLLDDLLLLEGED